MPKEKWALADLHVPAVRQQSRVNAPTGLLYGRVQSGKTVAMIAFTAAAIDNGFRVVVVLTSDNVKLVEQTAKRFSALAGPLIKHSTAMGTWSPDADHVRTYLPDHGVVLICTKNQSHMKSLVDYLQSIEAAQYPAIILDDEADQATLDTSTAARAAQRPNAPSMASAINRRTVHNDSPTEPGESVRERLPHHVFVQVTATPYALLLQDSDHPLRPSFTSLLEPAPGYRGGESFFDAQQVDRGGHPPLIFVDENESGLIQRGVTDAPEGLRRAVAFFLVAASAQAEREPQTRSQGQNFLCHTSQRQSEHARVADLIRGYVAQMGEAIKDPEPGGEVGLRLGWAYAELGRTLDNLPPWATVLGRIRQRLHRREILLVNSTGSNAEFGHELNFIVGGNILGRGLTIENLLVTYYLRRALISQMDTVQQHARMFGYRQHLMPYTRVFLPESLAFRFHSIHTSEQRLRTTLETADPRSRIPVETALGLRPTRPNVLDTGSLFAYGPGEQVYPLSPILRPAAQKNARVEQALIEVFGGALRPGEFVRAPIGTIVDIMKMIPIPEDDAGRWDPEILGKVLVAIAGKYGGEGSIYYRQMERSKPRLTTAAASGDETVRARDEGRPVLFVFRDTGKYLKVRSWYPTLFLPMDMNTQVFNVG